MGQKTRSSGARLLLLATAQTLLPLGMLLAPPGCAPKLKKDADQSQIRYQLAADYFRNRRTEAALEELQRALKLDPENAEAYNLLGLISLQQGAESVAQAETDACLKGTDAEAVRRDASARFKEAETQLRKATELRADYSEAWNNLAVTALKLQNFDLAAAAARNALKNVTYTEPEVARANLGWALFQQKNVPGAWKELHDAVARAPGFCVGRYRLAKIYVERADYDRAAEQIDAVVTDARCPIQEAYLLGGLVYQRRKETERAGELFSRCAEMAPRSCLAAECKRYSEMIQ
jgi:Tfp pilus assembly protein PilF